MSDMFSNHAYDAIEDAINRASPNFCEKVNLHVDLSNRKLQKDCHECLGGAIANKRHRISADQEAIDLIAYSATHGWLHGYACARQKALLEISAKNEKISTKDAQIERQKRELGDTKINLGDKTEEAENSEIRPNSNKAESEEPEPADEGQTYQKPRRAKYLVIGIAIGVVITAIACIIIDSQMMG